MGVDAGRFTQQRQALDALAGATSRVERGETLTEKRGHVGDAFARRRCQPRQHRHVRPVFPTHQRVRQRRGAGVQELRSQPARGNPGACGQLEVLGQSPCKAQSASKVGRVMQLCRIAGAVEAFVVEHVAIRRGIAQIAPCDHRSAQSYFVALTIGHQLHRQARHRQADPYRFGWKVDGHAAGGRLGRAVTGREENAFADGLYGEFLKAIVQRLRESGAAVERELQIPEKSRAQIGVAFQGFDQHCVAGRNVDIELRRDIAKILQRFGEQPRHWLAAVDIQRSATAQHAHLREGAGDMVPGQPVEHVAAPSGGLAHDLPTLREVGRDHPLCLHDGLRQAGRARRKHVRGRRIRIEFGDGAVYRSTG